MQETVLLSIPLSELQTLIIDSVNACLDVRTQPPPSKTDKFLNIREASKIVDRSVDGLYILCRENKIPHYKNGGRYRFVEKELIKWLKDGRRKTINEISDQAENNLENLKSSR